MLDFLESILGTYTPVTYETFQTVIDSTTGMESSVLVDVIPNGVAGVDWLYVLTGVMFIVVIGSVLKLLGGLICKIS